MVSGSRTAIRRKAGPLRAAVAAIAVIAAAPASAGWQDEFGTLRIGMVSPSGSRAIAGLSSMTAAFQEAAGVPTEIFAARDAEALIRAIASRRVHYAVLSGTAYAIADAYCQCVEPLAAPRAVDGAIGLRAAVIARRDHALILPDLSNARVVSGPVDEIGPQALALAAISEAGPPGHKNTVVHVKSQSEAEAAFAKGKADAVVGWLPAFAGDWATPQSGTMTRLETAGLAPEALEVVWTSGIIAFGPHAVRRDMPGELKVRLTSFLENLYDSRPDIYALLEPYRGGGFKRVRAADFETAAQIVRQYSER